MVGDTIMKVLFFFLNTNKGEIKSTTDKNEWKSIFFICQSYSLHYNRLILSSLKEGQANNIYILGTNRKYSSELRRSPVSQHRVQVLY